MGKAFQGPGLLSQAVAGGGGLLDHGRSLQGDAITGAYGLQVRDQFQDAAIQGPSDLHQPREGDAIGSEFILLDLLKADTDYESQRRL